MLSLKQPRFPRVIACLLVLSGGSGTAAPGEGPHFLWPCGNFTDTRNIVPKEDSRAVVVLPLHLTSGQKSNLLFTVGSAETTHSPAREFEKYCKNPRRLKVGMTLDNSSRKGLALAEDKYSIREAWKSRNDTYFTADGYLHYKSHFWNVNDYCVESISEKELLLKTCKLDCSADLSKTYLYAPTDNPTESYPGTSRVCLPKCCGVHEILSVGNLTCRPLNDTESPYFFPYLHLPTPPRQPSVEAHKVLVIPSLTSPRATWNTTHGLIPGVGSLWEQLHFFQRNMDCPRLRWQGLQYHDLKRQAGKRNKYNFRVEVAQPVVTLSFLTRSRKWVGTPHQFCVDGADNWGPASGGGEISQVVVWCEDDSLEGPASSRDTISPLKVLHIITLALCSALLFLGLYVFIMLRSYLSVPGKIIASHLGCVAGSYGASFLAAVVSLSEHARGGSNAVVIVSSEFDGYRRIGSICVGLGVIGHYFYLASYLWLSALNSEAWGALGQLSKKYWLYGTVGWLLPVVCIAAFCVVDGFNNDPWSEVIVPDYGVESCHVASWSSLYYVHSPVAVIFLLNFVYLLGKVGRGCYRKYLQKPIDGVTGDGPWRESGIPFRFFTIIYRVQLFSWIVSLTEALRVYNGHEDNWARAMLLFMAALGETLALLYFYCMHQVILELMQERAPRLKGFLNVLKKSALFRKNERFIECVFDEDGHGSGGNGPELVATRL